MASSASTRTQRKWQSFEEKKQRKPSMARPNSDEYAATCSESQEVGTNKDSNNNGEDDVCSKGCATPKGKRFRIQEVLTCPPAPKKRRVIQNYSSKSPIAFFASPDIELFFFSALRNVKA